MPRCYQLIGVPGAGKSTWIGNQSFAMDCMIVSTDDFVEDYARECGSTYSEVFEDYMPTAVRLMTDRVLRARGAEYDIIWDQTSTTVGSRRKKFNMLPKYEHIAVVFDTPPREVLEVRLASRPGKHIPQRVVTRMIEGFEMPTLDEGFKEIWKV